MPKRSIDARPASVAGWIIGIGIAWFLAVTVQGFLAARELGPDWLRFDYDLSAQFGDSFGSLSSLLAALAAIGAWRAVQLQQQEMAGRESEAKANIAAAQKAAFETTFFHLLQLQAQIVATIDIKPSGLRRIQANQRGQQLGDLDVDRGKDALRRIARSLLGNIEPSDPDFAMLFGRSGCRFRRRLEVHGLIAEPASTTVA